MTKRKRKKKMPIVTVIFVFIAIISVISAVKCYNSFEITNYELYSSRLPQGFDGYKVVQLSDMHGKTFGDDNSEFLQAIRDAEPDVIAITGDMFDENTAPGYVREMTKSLVDIAPVYYCSGNHEWVKNPRETFKEMQELGAEVMRNQYFPLERNGDSIIIAGVDDPNGPYDMISREDFVEEIKSETDDYILMLCHRNHEFDTWRDLGVDTVLSGHAHGGIVRLPIVGGLFAHGEDLGERRLDGIFTEGDTTMVVSRGIGNNGIIPRINNMPEIVVITLRCK